MVVTSFGLLNNFEIGQAFEIVISRIFCWSSRFPVKESSQKKVVIADVELSDLAILTAIETWPISQFLRFAYMRKVIALQDASDMHR